MNDEAFYKSESKFYDCNSQISHHNEFSIKCPPNPHWLMDEPLKQRVPSKIYGSSCGHEEARESELLLLLCSPDMAARHFFLQHPHTSGALLKS